MGSWTHAFIITESRQRGRYIMEEGGHARIGSAGSISSADVRL